MGVEDFVRQWEATSRRLARGLRHKVGPRRARRGRAPDATRSLAATAAPPSVVAGAPASSGVETITSLEQLDDKLRDVEAARVISDDAMRKVLRSFEMIPS